MTVVNRIAAGMLPLFVASGAALAQGATGAEARLQEKQITLPPVPAAVTTLTRCRWESAVPFRQHLTGAAQWQSRQRLDG
jgi:hypothetical protein